MKLLLFILMVGWIPALSLGEEEPVMQSHKLEISLRTKIKANTFGNEIERGRLAERTNQALDAAIRLAVYKLKRVGKKKDAERLLREWEDQWSGYLTRTRGIGDHAPLSKWLSEKYSMLEFTLGKDIVYALRLSDIHTINHAIPVVFKCIDQVDEVEYFKHFVHDEDGPYRGLAPVVVYWTTFFVCVGGTWGTGFLFCGPIAMGTEWLTKNYVGPKLNEPLWKRACGVNEREIYASNSCSYMEAVRWDAR